MKKIALSFGVLLLLISSCEIERSPEVVDISYSPESGLRGTWFTITANATDENGDPLTYQWSCDEGRIAGGNGSAQIVWESSTSTINKSQVITVEVSDGTTSVQETIVVEIEIPEPLELSDSRDGINYVGVKIDNQSWMGENLKYLPSVNPILEASDTEPHYYVYEYDGAEVSEAKASDNFTLNGVLYNWEAALTACPAGWHLPSDDEWKYLESYLGMNDTDLDQTTIRASGEVGEKLKSTTGWYSTFNGNNSSGFNALPSGRCGPISRSFAGIGVQTFYWTSTPSDPDKAWIRHLDSNDVEGIGRISVVRNFGASVRCIKD